MKNPLLRMREMHDFVGSAEREAAERLLNNPEYVPQYTIRELAAKIYVSPSTIVRLCKHLGFDGYREFRQAVVYEMALFETSSRSASTDIKADDEIEEIVEKVTYRNIISLEETQNLVDTEKMETCVDMISKCKNLYIFGIGASFCVAKDAYLKFIRINKPCFINEDWHAQLISAGNTSPEDVAILISYSGETPEMVRCMEELNKNNCPTIVITRFAPSTIAKMATHVLYTSASESIFRSGASSSRISQLNIIDILYSIYASKNYEECMPRLLKTHIPKPNTAPKGE